MTPSGLRSQLNRVGDFIRRDEVIAPYGRVTGARAKTGYALRASSPCLQS